MRQRDDRYGSSLHPKILIADEPTTLGCNIQAQIVDLVKKLRDGLGMSIIWITHDLGVVAGMPACDRNVCSYIVEEASDQRMYSNPQHPYTLGLLKAAAPG